MDSEEEKNLWSAKSVKRSKDASEERNIWLLTRNRSKIVNLERLLLP